MSNPLRFYLGFNLVPGIGPTRLQRLIEQCGSIEAAYFATVDQLRSAGCDQRARAGLARVRAEVDLDAELQRLQKAGVQPLCFADAAYPPLLRHVVGAPPLIYVRGSLAPSDMTDSLAVVGTRRPTSYGRDLVDRVVGDLAAYGLTIVSGLALGIDTLAHRSALARGSRTIAVLAGGVDRPYPLSNRTLADRITDRGALISDYPLGTPAAPLNFPPRNRIISGLSRAVLVVEAGRQSGAMITVNFALDQGREVFAVPGSVFNPASSGPNHLIRLGAVPITCADDVLEALDLPPRPAPAAPPPTAALSDEERITALLRGNILSIDEISRAAGLPANYVAATLALLEVRGIVRRSGPQSFVV